MMVKTLFASGLISLGKIEVMAPFALVVGYKKDPAKPYDVTKGAPASTNRS
jgi:hypothetical protein